MRVLAVVVELSRRIKRVKQLANQAGFLWFVASKLSKLFCQLKSLNLGILL